MVKSFLSKLGEALLVQGGNEDPEVRLLSLATINDDDLVSVAAVFWTQTCWIWVLVITAHLWLLPLMAIDLLRWASQWRLRRGLTPWGAPIAGTAAIWAVGVNVAWTALIACEILILLYTPSQTLAFLGVILAIGYTGYVTILFAAFPVLATLSIVVLCCSLGVGLATGCSDEARPLALLSICGGLAYWLLMRRSHLVLLGALRAQLSSRQLALHDPLTKLPNRALMREQLTRRLAAASPHGSEAAAVLCLDLDGFKAINDRHGHAAGDWVLVHVADILRRMIGPGDTASRTGGDEFVIVLAQTDGSRIRTLAEAVIGAVAVPFDIGRTVPARIGVSIGGALAGPGARSVDDLLEAADRALYEAKRNGKMCFCLSRSSGESTDSKLERIHARAG